MTVYLVDGTYELFRHFYAMPSAKNAAGEEVAAVRGVMYSIRGLVRDGATHIGIATDHVIESFRNALWDGYKTGDGIAPDLWAQFPLLEEALAAWGLKVWPMVDVEADDALAAAAAKAALDHRVEQVIICSPDKDLAQCVRGTRIVQRDRVRKTTRDEAGVISRFGVPPVSIPDYLALVGDTSDGFPGLAGWAPSPPQPSWPASAISSRFLTTLRPGASRFRGPGPWPPRSDATAIRPDCSANSPPCAPTSRCSILWTNSSGRARHQPCRRCGVGSRSTTDRVDKRAASRQAYAHTNASQARRS